MSKLGLRVAGGLLTLSAVGIGSIVAASGANAWDPAVWDKVAYCESTNRWDINTGNGYYGGLQFSHSTWAAFGGQTYAPEANGATKDQQIAIARRVLSVQGPGAWPACSVKAGLTKDNGGADRNALPSGTAAAPAPTTVTTKTATATPAPAASEVVSYKQLVKINGVMGPLTIAEMQRWTGAKTDGIWGRQTSKSLQVKVGAKVTGVRDRQTTVKLQSLVGTKPDGIWGRQTTTGLQKFLNAR